MMKTTTLTVLLRSLFGLLLPATAMANIDLSMTAVSTSSTSAAVNTSISVNNTERNGGTVAATAHNVKLYLSLDNLYQNTDILLGSRSLSSLAAGASSAVTTSVTLPAATPTGSYYLIALADADKSQTESNETNNTLASVGKVTVTSAVDLIMTGVSTTSASIAAGNSILISNTEKNQGTAAAVAHSVRFYLSSNTTYEATDLLIGSRSLSSLAAGASSAIATTVTIPATTPSGSYHLIAMADGAANQSESNEANNVLASAAKLTVATSATSTVYYIHPDHLNTPRLISEKSGETIWRWDNADPFGNNTANEDPDANGQKFTFNLRFPGQYYDKETGLHYNYYRDYNPKTGRYVQSDPIGLGGGINTYGYVGGNPLGAVDPLGLVKWTGDVYSAMAISGAGGAQFWFDLKSECVNGKYAYIRVYASALGVGLGLKYTGSWSTVSFEDNLSQINPNGFSGAFKMAAAGVGAILTGGYSALQLGNNTANFSTTPSAGVGLDMSISGLLGRSRVTSVEYKDCDCATSY